MFLVAGCALAGLAAAAINDKHQSVQAFSGRRIVNRLFTIKMQIRSEEKGRAFVRIAS